MRVMIVVHLPQRRSHAGHKAALQKKMLYSTYNHVRMEVREHTDSSASDCDGERLGDFIESE